MRPSVPFISSLVLAAWLAAAAASAQSPAFASPRTSVSRLSLPSKATLDDHIEDAPWRLGGVRVTPWLGLRHASSVVGTNIGDGSAENDDVTITAGAGLRAYLRSGPKVVWAAHLLPEYTYWADDPSRRRVNGRYGAGFFGYFNRLEVEVSHRLLEQQDFFSSEVQRLTPSRTENSRALFNLRLSARIWLNGGGERVRVTNLEDGSDTLFSQLDRTEDAVRAGLEYRGPTGWRLRLAGEDRSVEFQSDARPLSNATTSLLLGGGFLGNRFAFDLEIEEQQIEPDPGSLVPERDETLGAVRTVWKLSERGSALLYLQRTSSYALSTQASYFVSQRLGVVWQGQLGRAVTLTLFGETGEDDFRGVAGEGLGRSDDVVSLGTQLQLTLAQRARLRLDVRHNDYSSSQPGVDRDATVLGIGIDILPFQRILERAFERLRIGDPGQDW